MLSPTIVTSAGLGFGRSPGLVVRAAGGFAANAKQANYSAYVTQLQSHKDCHTGYTDNTLSTV
jgi:hypothetical protein